MNTPTTPSAANSLPERPSEKPTTWAPLHRLVGQRLVYSSHLSKAYTMTVDIKVHTSRALPKCTSSRIRRQFSDLVAGKTEHLQSGCPVKAAEIAQQTELQTDLKPEEKP
jgi:hypothetical protein